VRCGEGGVKEWRRGRGTGGDSSHRAIRKYPNLMVINTSLGLPKSNRSTRIV